LTFTKEETEVPGENSQVRWKATEIQPCTMIIEVGGSIDNHLTSLTPQGELHENNDLI